jgi:hypothetical protein
LPVALSSLDIQEGVILKGSDIVLKQSAVGSVFVFGGANAKVSFSAEQWLA